jgi:hypothetical protein
MNVWCSLIKGSIIGSFFFVEATVTGGVYLDMLEQFMYSQVPDLLRSIFYQQHGASTTLDFAR